jgi:hypothetical protein
LRPHQQLQKHGLKALAVSNEATNLKDLEWSQQVAEDIAHELVAGKVISSEQIAFATEIAAQQIHIWLVSGKRPPNLN